MATAEAARVWGLGLLRTWFVLGFGFGLSRTNFGLRVWGFRFRPWPLDGRLGPFCWLRASGLGALHIAACFQFLRVADVLPSCSSFRVYGVGFGASG